MSTHGNVPIRTITIVFYLYTMFNLDRTKGKGHSHKDAADQAAYWKTKTVDERFAAVMYLNSIAYNFDANDPPRLDRTVFRTRKHASV